MRRNFHDDVTVLVVLLDSEASEKQVGLWLLIIFNGEVVAIGSCIHGWFLKGPSLFASQPDGPVLRSQL